MNIQAVETSITTSETTIVTTDGDSSSLAIYNTGSVTVYLGGSGVSSAQGFPLLIGSTIIISIPSNTTVYGITASGTGTLRILATGGIL